MGLSLSIDPQQWLDENEKANDAFLARLPIMEARAATSAERDLIKLCRSCIRMAHDQNTIQYIECLIQAHDRLKRMAQDGIKDSFIPCQLVFFALSEVLHRIQELSYLP